MRQASAYCPAISSLNMADIAERLGKYWGPGKDTVMVQKRALSRHGSYSEQIWAQLDVRKLFDVVQIDKMVDEDISHVEHWHEGLPAGEQLCILETAKHGKGIAFARGEMIGEWCWFHRVVPDLG